MAKVLLINPGFEIKEVRHRYQLVFPFGLGYIAAYAEKHKHEMNLWDIHANRWGFKKVLNKIKSCDFSSFDFIGITGIVNQYLYIKELSKALKQYTKIPIVLGGPLATYSSEVVLKNTDVDICVIGEGEQTFLDLLDKKELSLIDGINYKENGEIKVNRERELIKNIDDIGFPAFYLFDMELYGLGRRIRQYGLFPTSRRGHFRQKR